MGRRALLGPRLRLGSRLGPDRAPEGVAREADQALRAGMRANAKRSDDELLFPRRNFEILAENGFLSLIVPEEYGGLGENHVAFCMTARRSRATAARRPPCATSCTPARCATIMLRPTPALIDKYIRPLNDLQDRDALLLRPRDRLALLVPVLLGRREVQRRLQGAQEGVVDDVGRLRRLLRRADHEPGLQGLRRPLGLRHRRRATSSPSPRCGTRSACAATSRARSRSTTSRSPATRSSAPSATAPPPTTRRSTRGSSSAPRRSGTASRWARSTSPSATRPASATSTSACASPTTRRSRTTSARR